MTTPKPKHKGADLAEKALVKIIEHPEQWNQKRYPHSMSSGCGCFIFWVDKFARMGPETNIVESAKVLRIELDDSWELFDSANTIDDLKSLCRRIFGLKSVKLSNGKRVRL